jgi:hypothetical protein
MLPESWTDVLDRIQQALAEAIAVAEQRERAAEAPEPAATEERWQALSAALDERFAALRASIEQSEWQAAEADVQLGGAALALQAWLEAAAAAGQRLAGG